MTSTVWLLLGLLALLVLALLWDILRSRGIAAWQKTHPPVQLVTPKPSVIRPLRDIRAVHEDEWFSAGGGRN